MPPSPGRRSTGHDVSIGYYDQELRDLDPKRRAIDAVWDEHPNETEEAMRSYLARFAFRGDDVFAPIEGLSGGEKGRLTLAVVMKQRHNLLLLDEPTNHLDLDSREALEESLEDFPGLDRLRVPRPGLHRPARDARHRPARGPRDAPARQLHRDGRRPGRAAAPARAAPAATNGPRAPHRREPRPHPAAAGPRRRARAASRVGSRGQGEPPAAAAGSRALEEKIAALETEIETLETRLWEEALTLGPWPPTSCPSRRPREGRSSTPWSRSGRASPRRPSSPPLARP